MKIAVIADIHDNIENLKIFFDKIKNDPIEKIICCGDVTNSETLKFISENFKKEIILVYGNMEIYSEKEALNYSNIKYLGRFNVITIDKFTVGVCHEPSFVNDLFKKNNEIAYIFYGHTHRPWTSIRKKAVMINPGTLGGVFQRPSFAVWDSESGKAKLQLIHKQ
jgi:uncharacterized protein